MVPNYSSQRTAAARSLRNENLRRAMRSCRDWLFACFLVAKRLFLPILGLIVVLVLPIHAFLSEGQHMDEVWADANALFFALVESAKVRPVLAAGVAIAMFLGWRQFHRRRISRRTVREVIDLHTEYMTDFSFDFEEGILRPLHDSSRSPLTQEKYLLIVERADELLAKLCNRLSAAFALVTRGDCCATLKIFDPNLKQISTKSRDLHQFDKRKRADQLLPAFSYDRNTAFMRIVDGGEEIYISNWLPLLWIFRKYKNFHFGWIRLYSATAVLPIVINDGSPSLVGFLCVDNLVGGFPHGLSKAILESYRGAARDVLMIMGRIRKREENNV